MASIYEAEIRRKPGARIVEDQLTARVFGSLAMLPKETILLPFLQLLAKAVISGEDERAPVLSKVGAMQYKDVIDASIELWKYIGDRYPDVCINTRNIVVVIEVKKNGNRGEKQLVNQYKGAYQKAAGEKKELAYFLLTKDGQVPPEVKEAQKILKSESNISDAKIHWRQWLQVPKWLKQIIADAPDLDEVSKTLIEATIKLLEDVEMMREPHIKKEWFDKSISKSLEEIEELTKEIRLTINRVNEKIEHYGLESLGQSPEKSVRFSLKNYDDEWIPKFFEFYYKHKTWKEVDEAYTDPGLYITFDLRARSEGITVGLWWKETPEKHIREINQKLGPNKNRDKGLRLNEACLNEGFLVVYQNIELDGLADGQIVDVLLNKLDEMRGFTESLATFREELGLEETSKRTRQAK